jgi:hypothetical protein
MAYLFAPGIDPNSVIVSVLFLTLICFVIYKIKDKILRPFKKAPTPEGRTRHKIEQLRKRFGARTDEGITERPYVYARNPYAPDPKPRIPRPSVANLPQEALGVQHVSRRKLSPDDAEGSMSYKERM